MEDCCAVCAGPLMFCAFGPCHHQEVCSSCVARMRLLQKNTDCAICRKPCPAVFVTRYMDSHTKRVPESAWEDLRSKAQGPAGRAEGLHYLKRIDAIFDDADHFRHMDAASGLTHPRLEEVTDVGRLHIKNVKDLKRIVHAKLGLSFCDLCLDHRQVFTSEQVLYGRDELKVHNSKGDPDGPLKDANFKGHPKCQFCKLHFYDSQEIYRHMEQRHYHCHLCRREHPDRHDYFARYEQLELHFEEAHHPCMFERCRADKFVVFASEGELKRHTAHEHGAELSMTRSQRRAAMTVEAGFRSAPVPRGAHGPRHARQDDTPDTQQIARPPVVIGGGGAGSIDMRARAHAEAMQESPAYEAMPVQRSLDLQAEHHFPGLAGSAAGAGGARGGGWGPGVHGAPRGNTMHADFPALAAHQPGTQAHAPRPPVLSRGQKKKMKANARRGGEEDPSIGFGDPADLPPPHIMAMGRPDSSSVAPDVSGPSRGAGRGGGARPVAGRGMPEASGSSGRGGFAQSRATIGHSSSTEHLAGAPGVDGSQQHGGGRPVDVAVSSFAALSVGDARESTVNTDAADTQGGGKVPDGWLEQMMDDMAGKSYAKNQERKPPPPRTRENFPALGQAPGGGGNAPALGGWGSTVSRAPEPREPVARAKPQLSSAADFPSLAGGSSGPPGPPPGLTDGAYAASADPQAANQAVTAAIKASLSPKDFASFKKRSIEWQKGRIDTEEFHRDIVQLGLAGHVDALLSICPDPERRRELMHVHSQLGNAATRAGGAPTSWACTVCSLLNPPAAENCEVCNTHKLVSMAADADARKAAEREAEAAANVRSGAKKKAKKGQRVALGSLHSPAMTGSAWGAR